MKKAHVPENRFGRYFFYAIGEIVLVVIGILIVLQVNKYNEESKIQLKANIYIEKLINDLSLDA